MNLTVSGKHLDIGATLKKHIETQISQHVKKYFDNIISVHVLLSKESESFRTDIKIAESGIIIKSSSLNSDPYQSADLAIHKIEKQLSKHKERLHNHRFRKDKVNNNFMKVNAINYILSNESKNIQIKSETKDKDVSSTHHFKEITDLSTIYDSSSDSYAPTIVAEGSVNIDIMSVRDAVMHLDFRKLSAYAFINSQSGKISIVYYRSDGNISWIEIDNESVAKLDSCIKVAV